MRLALPQRPTTSRDPTRTNYQRGGATLPYMVIPTHLNKTTGAACGNAQIWQVDYLVIFLIEVNLIELAISRNGLQLEISLMN